MKDEGTGIEDAKLTMQNAKWKRDKQRVNLSSGLDRGTRIRGRKFRDVVLEFIASTDLEQALSEVTRHTPPGRLLRPLMSLIRSEDVETRHRAVTALGWVTVQLAESDLESARDVVRRLMLTLTEESGGIGWGSPESIGEILARHAGLADEFADMLISYTCPHSGNYLEHEPLQRGVLWGLGRLAQARPDLLKEKVLLDRIQPHLESNDAQIRELAVGITSLLEAGVPPVNWSM